MYKNRVNYLALVFLGFLITLVFACTYNQPALSTNSSNSNPTVEQSNAETQKNESKDEEQKHKFELLSIDPGPFLNKEGKELFHGEVVLGKTEITDEQSRKKILDALKKGMRDAKKADRGPAACFEPRHGICIINHGHTTDYLICFACWRVTRYVDNQLQDDEDYIVTDYPETIFNNFLVQAGIPLAKR